MIVYGVCIGPTEKYETICKPSLPTRAIILERRDFCSIFSAYNSIMEEAVGIIDLEALVLLHDDVAIGANFERDLRAALATGADVVGAVGAVGPRSIAWWKGEPRGRAVEVERVFDYGGGTHLVDTVDGLLLALTADLVKSTRFDDQTFSGFHGYDIDFCTTARSQGRKVVVAPLDLVHHTKANRGDINAWRRADLLWRRKWGYVSPCRYWCGWGLLRLHVISHWARRAVH